MGARVWGAVAPGVGFRPSRPWKERLGGRNLEYQSIKFAESSVEHHNNDPNNEVCHNDEPCALSYVEFI